MTKAARVVPKGTFEQPKPFVPSEGRDRDDPNWDWRNPHDNPSGVQPVEEKPHKYRGEYKPERYPMLTGEEGEDESYKLFHPDLVSHLRDEYLDKGEWDKMTETEQIKTQIDFVSDCRHPMFHDEDGKWSSRKYDEWLTARAKHLQKQIQRKA